METPDLLRYTRVPLSNGSGAGPLIPDPAVTSEAVKVALEVGFRYFDCAERYRNEAPVGDAMQALFKAGGNRRVDVFVTTTLCNTDHRPERVLVNG